MRKDCKGYTAQLRVKQHQSCQIRYETRNKQKQSRNDSCDIEIRLHRGKCLELVAVKTVVQKFWKRSNQDEQPGDRCDG